MSTPLANSWTSAQKHLDATDVDDRGCAAIERDTDGDGINDPEDQCEGTPQGLTVNTVGCADIDSDGVFANVDDCAKSLSVGLLTKKVCSCTTVPVDWTDATSPQDPCKLSHSSHFQP